MRNKLFGLVAAIALVVASCGGSSVEESGALSSGIGVHGAWTIDVVNADGSLDQHVEFDNALAIDGDILIAEVFGGESSVGDWLIVVQTDGSGAGPCNTLNGTPSACNIVDPDGHFATNTANYFQTLEVGRADGVLTLSGSATATNTTDIGQVFTSLFTCAPDTAPDVCALDAAATTPNLQRPFTVKNFAAPVAVTAGQTIQIQVDLSFGTLP